LREPVLWYLAELGALAPSGDESKIACRVREAVLGFPEPWGDYIADCCFGLEEWNQDRQEIIKCLELLDINHGSPADFYANNGKIMKFRKPSNLFLAKMVKPRYGDISPLLLKIIDLSKANGSSDTRDLRDVAYRLIGWIDVAAWVYLLGESSDREQKGSFPLLITIKKGNKFLFGNIQDLFVKDLGNASARQIQRALIRQRLPLRATKLVSNDDRYAWSVDIGIIKNIAEKKPQLIPDILELCHRGTYSHPTRVTQGYIETIAYVNNCIKDDKNKWLPELAQSTAAEAFSAKIVTTEDFDQATIQNWIESSTPIEASKLVQSRLITKKQFESAKKRWSDSIKHTEAERLTSVGILGWRDFPAEKRKIWANHLPERRTWEMLEGLAIHWTDIDTRTRFDKLIEYLVSDVQLRPGSRTALTFKDLLETCDSGILPFSLFQDRRLLDKLKQYSDSGDPFAKLIKCISQFLQSPNNLTLLCNPQQLKNEWGAFLNPSHDAFEKGAVYLLHALYGYGLVSDPSELVVFNLPDYVMVGKIEQSGSNLVVSMSPIQNNQYPVEDKMGYLTGDSDHWYIVSKADRGDSSSPLVIRRRFGKCEIDRDGYVTRAWRPYPLEALEPSNQ
jgi:hypothetical protein